MKYKLIAFDYDGTLVDTFRFHSETIGKIVRDCGSHISKQEMDALIGKTLQYIFEQTLPKEKYNLAEKKLEKFYQNIPIYYWKSMSLMERAKEVLIYLHKNDIKIALVTNSHKKLVFASLQYFGLQNLFDWIEAADENSYHKEDRMRKILSMAEVSANKALYVGDTSGDIRDAHNVGMDSCLVYNKFSWIHRENVNVEAVKSEYIIRSLSDLSSII